MGHIPTWLPSLWAMTTLRRTTRRRWPRGAAAEDGLPFGRHCLGLYWGWGLGNGSRFFATLGKIAGIGGLALGVFLLIFQSVLKQNLLFSAGLSQDGAFYNHCRATASHLRYCRIGIVAWLISRVTLMSLFTRAPFFFLCC